MDCKASGKNSQEKINACERGEAERDAEEVQIFPRRQIYDSVKSVTMLQPPAVVAF